jgi:hypothetical protein
MILKMFPKISVLGVTGCIRLEQAAKKQGKITMAILSENFKASKLRDRSRRSIGRGNKLGILL